MIGQQYPNTNKWRLDKSIPLVLCITLIAGYGSTVYRFAELETAVAALAKSASANEAFILRNDQAHAYIGERLARLEASMASLETLMRDHTNKNVR